MAARVIAVTGPAGCGKTERLLKLYREALRSAAPDSALWLAPTHRSVADVLGRLPGPELPACLAPNVMTFAGFAQAVLDASGQTAHPLPILLKRQLVRFLIEQERATGRLKHFAPIAHTHGLVDLVVDFIRELKRLEIWPEEFRRACEARGLSDKDRELLAIYEAYQQRLRDHQLYDAEGRFWSARDLLGSGQQRPFEHLRLVVADGFTDFTRTQHEILALLAQRCEAMYVSLPLEAAPRREDLFFKSADTLAKLRKRLGDQLIEEPLPRRDGDWPGMQHIERELFKNPREATPAANVERIEIIGASRELGEVEQIGRRIKKLLSEGCDASGGRPVSPSEIVVVFRSLTAAAPLVREVFTELGLPFVLETEESLDESPLAAAVVALLKLAVEDWPFRQLVAVLGSNYFQPDWPQWQNAAVTAQRVVRSLQVPSGAGRLLAAIERRAEQRERQLKGATGTADDPRGGRLEQELRQARSAFALLGRLREALGRLPAQATQAEWTDALCAVAQDIGLTQAIARGDASLVERDQAAWTCLVQALRDGGALFGQIGEEPPRLSAAEFLDLVIDLLRWQRLPRQGDEVGRVRVLSAASLRALRTPYLFFAGLSERAFPSPQRHERLYGEAEYRQLRQRHADLPLPLRDERSREEMLLFYEVITRATKQLWLSYPALDEKAEPLLPSPYLREVERACGEGRIPHGVIADLSPVPPADAEPQSLKDFRLQAMNRALAGNARLLAALPGNGAGGLRQSVLEGMEVIGERATRRFGRFDGVFAGDVARAELARAFGPQHRWTVSHLEQYALCAHRFFLQHVVGAEPLDELALEPDYLQRGSLLHDLLARLHQRINEEMGEPTSPAEYNPRQFDEEVAEALRRMLPPGGAEHEVEQALREIDRRVLLEWAANYRQQHAHYDGQWQGFDPPPRPAHFEVSFGLPLSSDPRSPDPLSTAEPLELTHQDEALLLRGRIDRLDLGRRGEQAAFNVIDYKSGRQRGRRSDQDTPDGRQLQLEIYALAAEWLLGEQQAKPWTAGYWYVRKEGYRTWEQFHEPGERGLVTTESWRTRRELILDRVVALIRGIRAGQFPMYSADEHCTTYCPFKTVCRVNHARALGKEVSR
jgi:ATP-dependent helicase/nuclease subunit B